MHGTGEAPDLNRVWTSDETCGVIQKEHGGKILRQDMPSKLADGENSSNKCFASLAFPWNANGNMSSFECVFRFLCWLAIGPAFIENCGMEMFT